MKSVKILSSLSYNCIVNIFRSSRPEVFIKKGVLINFAGFAGKHFCWSLFFNKVAGLRPATLLKKRLWQRCFLMNFVKFLRTQFFIKHFRCLLLYLWVQWFLNSPQLWSCRIFWRHQSIHTVASFSRNFNVKKHLNWQ